MDNKSFWLANISNDSLTVSLITFDLGKFKVASIGSEVLYQPNGESFVAAIDQSLSESAANVDLSESAEPNSIALIIPPFWVGSDGKIVPDKIKLFEDVFKELRLRPMGFISYDDAIVEEANIADGFPASFIIVKIEANSFVTSLTYLGKVIERIIKPIFDSFDPVLLESTLLELKTDSTLPPQMILIGNIDNSTLEKIKNYPWIGKKNIETFLHFPDVKLYSTEKITSVFTTAITSQFQPPLGNNSTEANNKESKESVEEPNSNILSEVTAEELGFSESDNFVIPKTTPEIITNSTPKAPIRLTFPKIKIPRISLPAKSVLIWPLVVSPLLVLIPFFFSSAKVTLYVAPYEFIKTVDVTLDPQAKTIDLAKKIVPVSQQNFSVTNTVSLSTTGRKVIGQRAQGEVVVYNKQDKIQSLPKGTILIDGSGHKFEMVVSAQVASSSSDLSVGVITLGQTKVMVVATDIGPEFNLAKDTVVNFKDFAASILVAKVSESISGGSKSEVKAVSATDRSKVESEINTQIAASVNDRITKELANNPGIIRDSVQIRKGHFDSNREIGEEADELTITSTSSISVLYFNQDQKTTLLNTFLRSEVGFKESVFSPDNFDIALNKTKLTITGKSIPSVNTQSIARLISGKSQSVAISLIKKSLPRVYNYQISTNLSFLKSINPLPFRFSNISIEVK